MFDITNLITNITSQINVDYSFEISEEQLKTTSIIRLNNLNFKGTISKYDEYYNITGLLNGEMILLDDVTLEEVNYKFNIEIDENFDEFSDNLENNLTILENNIDLISFLWQNIVLEVPSKVRKENSEDIKLSGDGWRLMTLDEYKEGNNLGLSGLKTLLDKRKE